MIQLMTDLILVKSGKVGRVGLWEVHHDHPHPNGEIFVKDAPMLVAMTPAVVERIKSGFLVECIPPTVTEQTIDTLDDFSESLQVLVKSEKFADLTTVEQVEAVELIFSGREDSNNMSVIDIDGIGPKTAATLKAISIETVGELAESTIDHPLVLRWQKTAQEMF